MKLNKEQKKHIESVRWLFEETNQEKRQSGRSYVLARVYIEQALNGRVVKIIDHAYITGGGEYPVNKTLSEVIQKIIRKENLPLKIHYPELELLLDDIKKNTQKQEPPKESF